MGSRKLAPPKGVNKESPIKNKTRLPDPSKKLTVSFSKFHFSSICLNKEFNNYFKDDDHFIKVISSFIGTILPKITSHTFNEIREGSNEGKVLHFHAVDCEHQGKINDVLKKYNFSQIDIEQMLEGNSIFEFSAILGHESPARVVCHKIDNVLEFLFLDTNHHIYMNEKFLNESLFYDDCPVYNSNDCHYMPTDCFAVGYLDENKLRESFEYKKGYSYE